MKRWEKLYSKAVLSLIYYRDPTEASFEINETPCIYSLGDVGAHYLVSSHTSLVKPRNQSSIGNIQIFPPPYNYMNEESLIGRVGNSQV